MEKQKIYRDINFKIVLFIFSLCLIGMANILVTKKLFSAGMDFYAHMLTAEAFLDGTEASCYPVYYIAYGFFNRVLRMGQMASVVYAQTFFSVLASVVTYGIARYYMNQWKLDLNGVENLVMLYMSFFGPIYSIGYNSAGYYLLGQGSYNAWHNPTNNTVKAVSLLTLFLFFAGYSGKGLNMPFAKKRLEAGQLIAAAGIMCLMSAFCKPSFAQIFLPALLVLLFLDLLAKRKTFMQCVQCGVFFIPAGLVILWQFRFSMYEGAGAGVEIAPFEVWKVYSGNIAYSIILGIAFPAFCILFCRNQREQAQEKQYLHMNLKVCVLMYVIAAVEYMFLAEKGNGRYHGNFGWSMNLAMGYLFLFSILHFLRYVRYADNNYKKSAVVSIGFLLMTEHLLWGIWYMVQLLLSEGIQCF